MDWQQAARDMADYIITLSQAGFCSDTEQVKAERLAMHVLQGGFACS